MNDLPEIKVSRISKLSVLSVQNVVQGKCWLAGAQGCCRLPAAGWNVRLVGKIGICSAFGHGQRLDKILQTLRGLFQSRRS